MKTIILLPGEEMLIKAPNTLPPPTPPDEDQDGRKVLPVPYLCQWSPTAQRAPGDCGPACVAMAIHYFTDQSPTIDQVSIACQVPPGAEWTSLTQLAKGARAHGLKVTHRRPLTREEIEAEIENNRPVVALIKYDELPHNQDSFNGAHFCLVAGIDIETIIIHDPDRLSGNTFGEFREVSWTDFLRALGSTSETEGNSYNNHGLLLNVR